MTELARQNRPNLRDDYQSIVYSQPEVFAEIVRSDSASLPPGTNTAVFLNGNLLIIEKGHGVYIEWQPIERTARTSLSENDTNADDWVIEGSPPKDGTEVQNVSSFSFNADIKDLRSYTYNDPVTKKGVAWVRFYCKDGTASETFHMKGGGYRDFVTQLQRYTTLSRSAKERNLVMFVDECTEALEKSVGMLNLNKDFVSRFLSNPYATSLTALGKVTNLITPLLDPDSNTDHQLQAMVNLDPVVEDETLRSHTDNIGFEHIFELQLPERPVIEHGDTPVDEAVWHSFRDEAGRITDVHSLKSLIFRGGIDPALRKTIWKYMLGYYKWDLTDEENKAARKKHHENYFRMKLQWMSMTPDQEARFGLFRDYKALIEKDVTRTDRTHPYFTRKELKNLILLKDVLNTYMMYNFDLGYVQGMSDFLSPLLVIMEDEVDTFWCFVGLMDRVHRNFELSQAAIKQQLQDLKNLLEIVNPKLTNYLESHDSIHMYFCFRWILVAFKREFGFDDIMHLWEVLWTDIPCKGFLLLCCVAILDGQMNMIIENKFGLTEILKHINNLSMKINLHEMLRNAEAIYHQLAAVQDKLPRHIAEVLSFTIDEDEATTVQ
uniref:TBC1 domain family member 15 n=1 Tax=Panagrellus redivivus TaxID=6233 RepID=A0A7E4UXG6_PANRE